MRVFRSCRKLGAEELTRQQVETQEALASEKVSQVEQEREKERQELKELRKQMVDIERSLMQQVRLVTFPFLLLLLLRVPSPPGGDQ